MPDFNQSALAFNFLMFSGAAVAVWIGGVKVASYADELAQRFNLSHAMLGLFLLAGVTSLPEVATSFPAAAAGNAELAVNNLLGSIVMQVALLALADLVFGKRALTSVVPDALVMLQGSLNVILLALVTVAITVGDILLFKTFKDPQHVGLLTQYPGGGPGLIHCNSSAGMVVEQPFSMAWVKMLTHAYRFKKKQLKSIK